MGVRPDAEPEELERFRIAVESELERTSLRALARKLYMSPTGLQKFLDGARPYGETVARLRRWYYGAAGVHQTPPPMVAAELRRYVITTPNPDDGVAKLLAAVDEAYRDAGMFTPEWVGAVRTVVEANKGPRKRWRR